MTQKIPESVVLEVVRKLEARKQPGWSSIAWEFQDDSEFILVKIELAAEPLERSAPDRMYAYKLLDQSIAPRETGDYSWMVVFVCEDQVCDSLMQGVY